MKTTVLFVCTHNSARSQMAEGLINSLLGSQYEAFSVGTEPSRVNPFAVKAMAEIGIDISAHSSDSIAKYNGIKFDYIVTVCDNAKETCPTFSGKSKYIHKSFMDPSSIKGEDSDKLNGFRKVRDEIKLWIERTFIKL